MEDEKLNIETDDSILIDNFKNGSRLAFNLIVQKYQKRVYWVVRRMVIDHDDANDVTQEVFIKMFSALKDFRGDSKFFTYVYRAAVNYSINHLNKTNKNRQRFESLSNIEIQFQDDSFAEDYDIMRRRKILESAISSLPEQQRAVFTMKYYDELTYEQIADILNKSVGGMKANYFHAMKKIQEFVKLHDKKEAAYE